MFGVLLLRLCLLLVSISLLLFTCVWLGCCLCFLSQCSGLSCFFFGVLFLFFVWTRSRLCSSRGSGYPLLYRHFVVCKHDSHYFAAYWLSIQVCNSQGSTFVFLESHKAKTTMTTRPSGDGRICEFTVHLKCLGEAVHSDIYRQVADVQLEQRCHRF